MEERIFTVKSNKLIARDVYEIKLSGDISGMQRPGQFVNIKLDGFYLRRPISVCDISADSLTLIYKTVGNGTEYMSTLQEGKKLDLLTMLGNGYDISKSGSSPLLIGGGCGVPPLYLLAKTLVAEGKSVTIITGFNTKSEMFYKNEFKSLGIRTLVATADGSYGAKGFVTDAMVKCGDFSYTYACGPEPMLKAVYYASKASGQYSFEERMGCGFGACMGCSCKTLYGSKRICKDGPVLEKEEIIWPTQE
ncbi:MAG: dihydroorotate dehydrogenase electron transfer subunit [Eubacteriales bacterium]|nr:dihydroorotate dehydrogenase electron transfer subunit [Eubacteriales bacterium]